MIKEIICAPTAQQVDDAIQDLWHKILQMTLTEKTPCIRSEMGDDINLIVPQLRVTYSIFYNPNLISTIYYSALESGRQGVVRTFDELGFDLNEFKQSFSWSRDVCFDAFEAVKQIVYDPVMKKLNKGYVKLLDVDIAKKMFLLEIDECGECWSFPDLNLRACQYTAGSFAGIWSATMGIEYSVYEQNCIAQGDDTCVFVQQPVTNLEHYNKVNEYISINPRKMYHTKDVVDKVAQHIENALDGKLKRPKYRDVLHLFDYQLRLLNSISKYPLEFSVAYYHAGIKFGKSLAHFLKSYYGVWGEEIFETALSNYYETLGFAKICSVEIIKDGLIITMRDVADCAGLLEGVSPHNFLCGELAGIASEVTGHEMVCENTKCREGEDKICEFKVF